MTMNLGEYPCTWIDMSSLVMSKIAPWGLGASLGFLRSLTLGPLLRV